MQTNSIEELAREDRFFKQRERARMQRIERGDKIAAIDRGDEGIGFERRAGSRVVPVIEMTAKFLQARDSGKAFLGEIEKFGHGKKAQFASCLTGVSEKADIGGRNARSLGVI